MFHTSMAGRGSARSLLSKRLWQPQDRSWRPCKQPLSTARPSTSACPRFGDRWDDPAPIPEDGSSFQADQPELAGNVISMPDHSYSAADIQVLEFDESVRSRPGMYFGVAREDQALATKVLCCVLVHALHPAASLAPAHTARAYADICADLTFSVTDDQVGAADEHGIPRLGYYSSLLGTDRWMLAAAAAVSSRAVVEVWQDGRGFRQELIRLRPAATPHEFDAPAGSGTTVTFDLDPAYFGDDAAITSGLNALDLHGPHCADQPGPGHLTIRDLRRDDNSNTSHYS